MKNSALQLTCALSLEAAEDVADGKPMLPRFRMVAYSGSIMKVGGWRYPVVVDLAGLVIPSQNRPIRLGHDAALGVGHTDAIRVEGGQLIATGIVSRDTSVARERARRIERCRCTRTSRPCYAANAWESTRSLDRRAAG